MSIDYHVFTQGGKPIFSLPLNRKKQLVSTSQEKKARVLRGQVGWIINQWKKEQFFEL